MKKSICFAVGFLLIGLAVRAQAPAGGQTATQAAVDEFDKAMSKLPPVIKPIDIAVQVIGLDIQKGSAAEAELNKVAAAGKGQYYSVADIKDLNKVFGQVTTGVTAPPAGGGGGGAVLPATGLSPALIAAIALGGAALLLAVVIVAVKRRSGAGAGPAPADGGSVSAGLEVAYADGGAKKFRITGTRTAIGRGEDNHLVLRDPKISTRHAELLASRDGFVVRDLGSANGTRVNGQPVTEAYLQVGDDIGLGDTHLTFTE